MCSGTLRRVLLSMCACNHKVMPVGVKALLGVYLCRCAFVKVRVIVGACAEMADARVYVSVHSCTCCVSACYGCVCIVVCSCLPTCNAMKCPTTNICLKIGCFSTSPMKDCFFLFKKR